MVEKFRIVVVFSGIYWKEHGRIFWGVAMFYRGFGYKCTFVEIVVVHLRFVGVFYMYVSAPKDKIFRCICTDTCSLLYLKMHQKISWLYE